jgi:hypothetical protein
LGAGQLALLSAIRKLRKRPDMKELIAELREDPDLAIEIASWK